MSRRLMLSLIAALAVFSALWLAVNIDRESHPGAKRIDISDIYRMRYADQNLSREDQINSANQLLSIRASAQKDGWTKFESADGRAIAQARVCQNKLGTNETYRFEGDPDSLNPEWLYVQPKPSYNRLAAMAYQTAEETTNVPFVLFRLSDCQFVQNIDGYPLTKISFELSGHDEWLRPHFETSSFATYVRSEQTTMYEIYLNPLDNTLRLFIVSGSTWSTPIPAVSISAPSPDCVSNFVSQAGSANQSGSSGLNLVGVLPSPDCFSLPKIEVRNYRLTQSEFPLKLRIGERPEAFADRVERDLEKQRHLSVFDSSDTRRGSIGRVPGLENTIDASLVSTLE